MKRIVTLLLVFTIVFGLSPTVYASKDTAAPFIKLLTPGNNSFGIPVDQTIVITFNENIYKGSQFSLVTLTDASGFETNYKVRIEKNVLSLKAIINLDNSATYKLSIPKGAVTDKAGNSLKKSSVTYFQTNPATSPDSSSTTAPSDNGSTKLTIKDIAKKANAVVYLEAQYSNHKVFATGSGFLVNGKLITNYHVIDGASYITMTTDNGKKYSILGIYSYDKDKDIAVLKPEASNLPSLILGDSDKIVIGESVVAIGSPVGLQNTVSQGIISSIRKDYNDSIQITAPIYSGSSGGALFNEFGNVIGITTSIIDTPGDLNFAIPINTIKLMLNSNTVTPFKELVKPTGKITYSFGIYEGDILNGKAHGQGILTMTTGTIYTGSFKEDMYNGHGVLKFASGDRYEGTFKDDKYNGQGVLAYSGGDKYEGTFKDDNFEGHGTYTWADGGTYVGEFKTHKFDGQGTRTYSDGDIYVGSWKNDKYEGNGILTHSNGEKYTGPFKEDNMCGQGVYTWPSGAKYQGEFSQGRFNGQGVYTFSDGSKYTGPFKNDLFDGLGTIVTPNGEKYIGEFKDGYSSTPGSYTYSNGKTAKGMWTDGAFVPTNK